MEVDGGLRMLTLFLRAIILYLVMILAMRAMGRRQLGQFQPYEFALTIILADLISTPMESVSTPLLQGLLPVAALFVTHCAITLISVKSDKARAVISGKPVMVISKGVIDEKQLGRLCMGISDLMEGLRGAGILDPAEAGTAVVESNGTISAFPRSSRRGPLTSEMGIDPGYEGLPMILVMDGHVQRHNLAQCRKDGAWLREMLGKLGMTPEETYFASVDTKGVLTAQKKQAGMTGIQAIPPEEVMW